MVKKSIYIGLALLGLFLFLYLFDATFPTASLDLRINRTQAREKAEEYLTAMGYNLSGYESSVVFSGDQTAFVFLEKSVGLKKANELTKEEIPIWYWQVRFFKELEKEGFEVRVNPTGFISGFSHLIEDRAPAESMSQDEAREKVLDFLKNQHNMSPEWIENIESRSLKRENRTDHFFEWKVKETEKQWSENGLEGEGMTRISARVHGSEIAGFESFFWTPEVFGRYIQKLFSEGRFLALISSFFYMILYVCAIVMFILSFKADQIRFKFLLSIALLIALPNILNMLNELPLIKAAYNTKMKYIVFFGSQLIQDLKGIINHIIVIIIVFCAGIYCAKKVHASRIEGLTQFLSGKHLPRSVRNEIVGGYIFAFIALGFVTSFYFIGMKYFGVWVFPSPKYSNILGTWFPFLLPLSLSIVAAVSEEFIFRMFAISFLKRIVRLTWLAVIIPALIWAFAHSSYAVFPIYTRGIELTIVACAFSYVYLRYGILACIVAHYVIDAVLFSIPLLRSSNTYFFISGIVVSALALVPALLSLRVEKKAKI